jgi:hypothetical protein
MSKLVLVGFMVAFFLVAGLVGVLAVRISDMHQELAKANSRITKLELYHLDKVAQREYPFFRY